MNHIQIKCLGSDGYNITLPTQKRDALLSLDESQKHPWILDIFDSTKKTGVAYIQSHFLKCGKKLNWNEVLDLLEVFN